MAKTKLEGIYIPMVTPFNADESINFGGIKEVVDFLVANGVTGVIPSGSTGEMVAMTPEEQISVNAATIKAAAGRIKVVCSTGAYRTQDVFGNPTLDFVTIKAASAHGAVLFALVYNAITGHADADLDNGQVRRFTFGQFPLTSMDMVETAASWDDPDTGTWVCDYSFVDSMLAEKNPGLTSDDIQKAIDSNLTYDSIYARIEGAE